MMDSKQSGAIGGAASGAQAGAAFGPYGMAVGAVVGGVAGFLGGGGEDEARELAEAQAKLVEETREYNRRRDKAEMAQGIGMARALIGASNIQYSGSSRRYVGSMESNFRQDIAWKDHKAKVEADLIMQGGEAAADSIGRAGLGSMVSSVGSAAGSGTFGTYTKSGGYKSPWE